MVRQARYGKMWIGTQGVWRLGKAGMSGSGEVWSGRFRHVMSWQAGNGPSVQVSYGELR